MDTPSRLSVPKPGITPVKPTEGSVKLHTSDIRAKILQSDLQGKAYNLGSTDGRPPHEQVRSLLDHFYKEQLPPDLNDSLQACRPSWAAYGEQSGQDNAFSLITSIVEEYRKSLPEPRRKISKEYRFTGDQPRAYHENSISTTTSLGVPGHELKPDVILRRINLPSDLKLEDKWTEVEMMWELKSSPDEVDKEKTIGALLLKGTAVLQDQYAYRRARVVAVLLCKFKLRILIMDRSGAYLSPVVDVEDRPDLLIRTVLGFLLAQDDRLGIEYSGDTDDFHLTVQGIEFRARRRPFAAPVYDRLVCRGTTCWRATWADESKRPSHWPDAREEEFPLVIKSSWPHKGRMSEGSILQMLKDEPTVSPLIAFERVVTTEKTQMDGLSVLGVNKHFFISAEATSDYNVQPQSSGNTGKSAKHKKVKPAEERVDDRAHDLTVTIYVGKPYDHRLHTHHQLWMAVTTGLVGAARISAKHRIIHRDISRGNLLIAQGPTFTRCCNRWAGLIDFDMAKRDSGVDNTTVDEGTFPDRTGTLLYMAITLLNTEIRLKRHLIWFDLESIFWVAFLCNLVEHDEKKFREIYKESCSGLVTTRNAKIGLLMAIKTFKRVAMAKDMASKRQVAAQKEGLSGSPCNDLTTDWEMLDKFCSRLHPKDLDGEDRFLYDLEMVPGSVSAPMKYELNTDTNRFPQTPRGLKDWIYETVDAILETVGNREEHGEWRRTVRDYPWGLDGTD